MALLLTWITSLFQHRAVLSIKPGTWVSLFTCSLTSFSLFFFFFLLRGAETHSVSVSISYSLCLCRKTDKTKFYKTHPECYHGKCRKWSATIFLPISWKIETINYFPLQSSELFLFAVQICVLRHPCSWTPVSEESFSGLLYVHTVRLRNHKGPFNGKHARP